MRELEMEYDTLEKWLAEYEASEEAVETIY